MIYLEKAKWVPNEPSEQPQRKLAIGERKSLLTEHRRATASRRKAFGFKAFSPDFSVRPDGAHHQWRKDPPR
jgi:hypothetical protein